MKIEGSTSVVTGGASGLGESVVRLFITLGGKVAIWDMNPSLGESLAKELGPNAIFIQTDVTSEESVQKALALTLKTFSKVNALVNCAGVILGQMTFTSKTVHSLTDFEKVIKINLSGTFNVCRLVAKEMSTQEEVQSERGVIVNVASIAAYEGQRGQTAYASSKGGVVGLTLPLARDLANFGIRVNSIAPGLFKTRMGDNVPKKVLEGLLRETLSKRFGDPSEFAHAVRFLVENTYMNGAVLRVDGGIRMPNI